MSKFFIVGDQITCNKADIHNKVFYGTVTGVTDSTIKYRNNLSKLEFTVDSNLITLVPEDKSFTTAANMVDGIDEQVNAAIKALFNSEANAQIVNAINNASESTAITDIDKAVLHITTIAKYYNALADKLNDKGNIIRNINDLRSKLDKQKVK